MPKEKQATILLVEDDPLIVRLYKFAFEHSGYQVEIAFTGEEGLAKLRAMTEKPVLILSDVMMPKMNGLDLLKKIKEDPKIKNIPLILLTNLDRNEDIDTGLKLGAITYLVKSNYEPREIVEKVKELLAGYNRGSVPEVKTVVKEGM